MVEHLCQLSLLFSPTPTSLPRGAQKCKGVRVHFVVCMYYDNESVIFINVSWQQLLLCLLKYRFSEAIWRRCRFYIDNAWRWHERNNGVSWCSLYLIRSNWWVFQLSLSHNAEQLLPLRASGTNVFLKYSSRTISLLLRCPRIGQAKGLWLENQCGFLGTRQNN